MLVRTMVRLMLLTINFVSGVGAYGMYRNPSGTFCSPGTNQSYASFSVLLDATDLRIGFRQMFKLLSAMLGSN